jgi:Fanconi anemia group M protein
MSQQLHICIDSNEASKQHSIVNYFKFSGFDVLIKSLDVCDYVVSDRVGIERKNVADFLSSMKDGRLFNQAKDIIEIYEKPIIVLEGQMKKALKRSQMRLSSIYGALCSLALDYNINVIPTDDPESTATLLHRLAYREQAKEERKIQLRSINRNLPVYQQQIYLLSGLPQIGTTLAEELLNTFETPYKVLVEFAAAEIKISPSGKTKRLTGPLKEVKGVGPKIVESAQLLLHESYPLLCECYGVPLVQKESP